MKASILKEMPSNAQLDERGIFESIWLLIPHLTAFSQSIINQCERAIKSPNTAKQENKVPAYLGELSSNHKKRCYEINLIWKFLFTDLTYWENKYSAKNVVIRGPGGNQGESQSYGQKLTRSTVFPSFPSKISIFQRMLHNSLTSYHFVALAQRLFVFLKLKTSLTSCVQQNERMLA